MNIVRCLLFGFCLFILLACEEENEVIKSDVVISNLVLTVNPSGYAPLTAKVEFQTNKVFALRLRVIGQHGAASDVVQDFPTYTRNFNIPILGLYAGDQNQVELTFLDEDGKSVSTDSLTISTLPLIADLPKIEIAQTGTEDLMPGWNLVNYLGFTSSVFPQRPFIFDQFGDIRWYVNFRGHPKLNNLFCDYGMKRLQNGNLIFGDRSSNKLYEIDMLGELQNTWDLPGHGFHHTVIEKTNGNLLLTANDHAKTTEEDVILEIDRNTGAIVTKWDLTQLLDPYRRVWETDRANTDIDWFHGNGLAYSEADNSIIVSGRTQGVVKLGGDGSLQWILAPHRNWEQAGNGTELKPYLLQPLDENAEPITEEAVLEGTTNHPSFEWNWYQHSPILLPNGNIMVFDNGERRNFNMEEKYSRAVEFKIDENARTVQQVWSYGKVRGAETHSPVVSNVHYDPTTDHVLFSPGAVIRSDGVPIGKVIEVDKQSQQLLWEATIIPNKSFYYITFHNVQRISLYGE